MTCHRQMNSGICKEESPVGSDSSFPPLLKSSTLSPFPLPYSMTHTMVQHKFESIEM